MCNRPFAPYGSPKHPLSAASRAHETYYSRGVCGAASYCGRDGASGAHDPIGQGAFSYFVGASGGGQNNPCGADSPECGGAFLQTECRRLGRGRCAPRLGGGRAQHTGLFCGQESPSALYRRDPPILQKSARFFAGCRRARYCHTHWSYDRKPFV